MCADDVEDVNGCSKLTGLAQYDKHSLIPFVFVLFNDTHSVFNLM